MKVSKRLISALLLVFMIFVATGMGPVTVEARTCESQSHKFKGKCISSTNCGNVCRTEGGFTGGICRGARSRCFCTRPC